MKPPLLSHKQVTSRSQARQPGKKAYQPPVLTDYGVLLEITQATTGTGTRDRLTVSVSPDGTGAGGLWTATGDIPPGPFSPAGAPWLKTEPNRLFAPRKAPCLIGRHLDIQGNLQKPNLGEVSFCDTLYSPSGTEGVSTPSTLGATSPTSPPSPGLLRERRSLGCSSRVGCTARSQIFC
jgi:hypothetical protein